MTSGWYEDWTDDWTYETDNIDEMSLKCLGAVGPSRQSESCKGQLLGLLATITQYRLSIVLTGEGARLVIPSDGLFESERSTLSPAGERVIDALANALVAFPSLRVQVEGHTDCSPEVQTARSRWHLGFECAIAVRERLVLGGVARARVHGLSFAGTRPIANNECEEGRAINRRIELFVRGPT